MQTYKIEYTKKANKEFQKLDPKLRLRIAKAIHKLRLDPKKGSVRPMVGGGSWRLRVGKYRVIYDIHEGKLVILVLKIAHRGRVYK